MINSMIHLHLEELKQKNDELKEMSTNSKLDRRAYNMVSDAWSLVLHSSSFAKYNLLSLL